MGRLRLLSIRSVRMYTGAVSSLLPLLLLLECSNSAFHRNQDTPCQCVSSDLCPEVLPSHGLLDIRFQDDTCPNYYDVCCQLPLEPPPSPTFTAPSCGISRSRAVSARITSNSDTADFAEFPWTVLVLQKNDRKSVTKMCGGALIHPQVVLTAAHCVSSNAAETFKVRAGEHNLVSDREPLPYQESSVAEVHLHPRHKARTLWNDIAVLILEEAFTESDNIGFACLPARNLHVDEAHCVAVGWGQSAYGRGRHSSVLRKVTMPVVANNKCQATMRTTRLGKTFKLHYSFMCAGGQKNRDTCKGDGGSPLICPVVGDAGRFVQMGIVSWGIGCGETNIPGVYVNVGMFVDWIDTVMKKNGYDSTYYKVQETE